MTVVETVKNATAMKTLGWILIVLSIVEFGIGGAVYGFLTNVHLGAWWGAICCFIAGICGAISNGRTAIICGCVFSIFAIIISIVGAIVDGLASAIISAETGCTNTDTYEFWGTTQGKYDAGYCAYGYNFSGYVQGSESGLKSAVSKGTEAFYNTFYNKPNNNNNNFFYNHPNWIFYYNVNHYFYNFYQTHNTYYWNSNHNFYNNYYYNSRNNNYGYNGNNNNFYNNYYGFSTNCVCSDGSLCYGYGLASGDDCGTILTTYSSLLSASTAFLSILVVVSFIYSIFTCIACNGSSTVTTVPVNVQPIQQVQMQQQYVQPGMQPVGYAPQPQYAPVGYAPQPMGYAPQPVGYAPQPMGYAQQQPVMYAAQPAPVMAAPVGYAPVVQVQAGDTKFV